MQTECLELRSMVQVLAWACQGMVSNSVCPAKAGACPFSEKLPCEKVGSADWLAVLKDPEEKK